MKNIKYTIIVPCFNEEENIEKIYHRIQNTMRHVGEFEILFINDGSSDNTLHQIKKIRAKDTRVKFISFLNNYGHQKAIFAGLHFCQHDFAITIDADLQHPPEVIQELVSKQKEEHVQIVAARRRGSQKGIFKNLFSSNFYRIFGLLTGLDMKPGISDFRLYSRKAIDIICSIKEHEPFLRGMIANLKLSVSIIDYQLDERNAGIPSYTLGKSYRMALYAFLRFSDFPVKVGIIIGLSGILMSLGQAAHYLYLRLFTESLIPGQADLMVFLGIVSSMILIQLSLLLRMNMQIMDIQRCQPVYIIEEKDITD